MKQHPLPLPPHGGIVPGPDIDTWVVRCGFCCYTKEGYTRNQYAFMNMKDAITHFATDRHFERIGENRLALYAALHQPGPHVPVGDDEW